MRYIDAGCWTIVRISAYGAIGGGLRSEDAARPPLPGGRRSHLLPPSLHVRHRQPASVYQFEGGRGRPPLRMVESWRRWKTLDQDPKAGHARSILPCPPSGYQRG